MKKILNSGILFIAFTGLVLVGCKKGNEKYNDGEVVEDSYTGNVNVTSGGTDPGGDITGSGDGGTYTFAWENNKPRASLDFDITTTTGSIQFIITDADGNEVLNKTRSAGGNDSFSGVTSAGTPGIWLVTIIITDFDGDASYSLSPGD